MVSEAGKGSKRRKENSSAFEKNYDNIKWDKKAKTISVKDRVKHALLTIKNQFPRDPDSQFMYHVVACAVEDGFLAVGAYRNRKAVSSAKRYLQGDMVHASLSNVDPDWIREILVKYQLDINAIPDRVEVEIDWLLKKLKRAISKVGDEYVKYYIAVTYNGDSFKVVKSGHEQWETVTNPLYPYRVGVYSHEATHEEILRDSRRTIDNWHGQQAESSD